MTGFEFIFALYALILGFSLVALLGGLGRALELSFARDADTTQDSFRVGWLTPLMAGFVMLDLMSFWVFAWTVRDLLSVTPATLLGVMGFASAYYLAARLVFPEHPERFADLDTHFFRVRRVIYLLLIALVAVQWSYLLTLEPLREALLNPMSVGMTLLFVALMLTGAFMKSRLWSAVILGGLIARYVLLYLVI